MPLFIILLTLEVALVVHVVKTGRNTMWIWIILMLPLAGSIAYLIVEVFPTLSQSRTAQRLKRNINDVVNPHRDIKSAVQNLSMADTVENTIRLAEECMKKGMYQEAKHLYEKSLKGVYENDPDLMFGLAKAEFELASHQATKSVLDKLIEKNPDYKNQDAHLLYARTAEALGERELATQEYEALNKYYSGPEATFRYAMFLKKHFEFDKCRMLLEKIISDASSSKNYRSLHREWIRAAENEFNNLG